MRVSRFTVLIVILLIKSLIFNNVYSQAGPEIRKSNFKTVKDGFKVAWDHVKEGDAYFSEMGKSYLDAYGEYKKALMYNSNNAALNYKTGVAAFYSGKRDEAAPYFLKAWELDNHIAEDVLLLAGRALAFQGKFDEAVEKLEAFKNTTDPKNKVAADLADRYISECRAAKELTKDTLRIEIMNAGVNINSGYDDYSIVFSPSGSRIYFGSRRPIHQKTENRYSDIKPDENIFMSDYREGGWSTSTPAVNTLNTEYCEVPLYLNKSEDRLFIYAGYLGNGDILVSSLKKGKWKKPEKEQIGITSNLPETSISFSPSGEEAAFIRDSDKKGFGGKDIYIVKKTDNRKWSKPVNAGITVNSRYDEESVMYSGGGDTLWFSSAGHNTMGGFDIFYSVRSTDGSWGPAVNAGFPVNTPWNELFYTPVPGKDSLFYFVSDRSGGIGGLDIYSARILPPPVVIEPKPEPAPPPPPPAPVIVRDTVIIIKEIIQAPQPADPSVYLTGRISDSETGESVMARIEIIDFETDALVTTTASSDIDGNYRVRLPEKKTYIVNIRATGFLSDMKKISVGSDYKKDFIQLDVPLIKVKVGKKVVLNNIFFELGKAVLTKESFEELNKLAGIMNDNPTMKIEISGHTDNTGSAVINARLSTERARAVMDYLVNKGIDKSRMTYMGYGSDQPVADNATPEGRARNRRVEFKILEM